MNLIVVPNWLEVPLKVAGLNLKDLINPRKLFGILSKEDVAFYFLCQTELYQFIPESFAKDFTIDRSVWQYDVGATTDKERADSVDNFFKLVEDTRLAHGKIDTLKEYLDFTNKYFDLTGTESPIYQHLGFDVLEQIDDVLFISVKGVNKQDLFQCYDDLFGYLSKTKSIDELARMDSFIDFENQLNDQLVLSPNLQ